MRKLLRRIPRVPDWLPPPEHAWLRTGGGVMLSAASVQLAVAAPRVWPLVAPELASAARVVMRMPRLRRGGLGLVPAASHLEAHGAGPSCTCAPRSPSRPWRSPRGRRLWARRGDGGRAGERGGAPWPADVHHGGAGLTGRSAAFGRGVRGRHAVAGAGWPRSSGPIRPERAPVGAGRRAPRRPDGRRGPTSARAGGVRGSRSRGRRRCRSARRRRPGTSSRPGSSCRSTRR